MAQAQYAPQVVETVIRKEAQVTLTLSVLEAAALHDLLYRHITGTDMGLRGVLEGISASLGDALPEAVTKAMEHSTEYFVEDDGRLYYNANSRVVLQGIIDKAAQAI